MENRSYWTYKSERSQQLASVFGGLRKLVATIVLGSLLIGAAGSIAASVSNHIVNGVRHGCPFDPGCSDELPDAVRHGYSRAVDQSKMVYAYLSVRQPSNHVDVDFIDCTECERIDIQLDLSGLDALECQFATYHYVDARDIAHNHFTSDGPC